MTRAILDKIQEQMADNLYLGASLAIFRDGQWTEHYIGRFTEEESVRPDLVYDIASVSKVVGVGTVLIDLIQSGRLDLNKPFKDYYPAFEDGTVTIRQLVTHTSGIDPFIPNRDNLDAAGLKDAMHRLKVTEDKAFRYTDVNLILLGFLVEELYGKSLSTVIAEEVIEPWGMKETSFGPRAEAVPTVKGVPAGMVHDPKARVLGEHCGSAGLFSTLKDLEVFVQHYLEDDFAQDLANNISPSKPRSIVWNIDEGGWLDHTGYTGPFLMLQRDQQVAAIFLTNRTYLYDDRPLWIANRRKLRDVIKEALKLK